MEITISTQQERPLLKRTEAVVRVFYQGTTPSRKQLLSVVADKLGTKKDLLIIDSIQTSFGDTVAHVHCRYYTTKDALERLERKNLQEKHVFEPKTSPEADASAKQDDSDAKASTDEPAQEQDAQKPAKDATGEDA